MLIFQALEQHTTFVIAISLVLQVWIFLLKVPLLSSFDLWEVYLSESKQVT